MLALEHRDLASYTFEQYLLDFSKEYTAAERVEHELIFRRNVGLCSLALHELSVILQTKSTDTTPILRNVGKKASISSRT